MSVGVVHGPEHRAGPTLGGSSGLCQGCGLQVPPTDRFCRGCGAAAPGSAPPAPPVASAVAGAQAPPSIPVSSTPAPNNSTGGGSNLSGKAGIAMVVGGAVALFCIAAVLFLSMKGPDTPSSTANPATTRTTQTTNPKPVADTGRLPDQTRRQMRVAIASLMKRHHQLIADGDYAGAYALYSSRKRNQPLIETPSCQSYTCWAPVMYPLQSGLSNPVRASVRVVRVFKGAGVAEVRVVLPRPNCPTGAWEGITWAKYENGRWTYDPGWKTDEVQRAQYKSTNGGNTQDSRLLGIGCDT